MAHIWNNPWSINLGTPSIPTARSNLTIDINLMGSLGEERGISSTQLHTNSHHDWHSLKSFFCWFNFCFKPGLESNFHGPNSYNILNMFSLDFTKETVSVRFLLYYSYGPRTNELADAFSLLTLTRPGFSFVFWDKGDCPLPPSFLHDLSTMEAIKMSLGGWVVRKDFPLGSTTESDDVIWRGNYVKVADGSHLGSLKT